MESEISSPISDTVDVINKLNELNIPTALLTNNWKTNDGDTYALKGKIYIILNFALKQTKVDFLQILYFLTQFSPPGGDLIRFYWTYFS